MLSVSDARRAILFALSEVEFMNINYDANGTLKCSVGAASVDAADAAALPACCGFRAIRSRTAERSITGFGHPANDY